MKDVQLIFAERSHGRVRQLVLVPPELALSIILECNQSRALKLVRPPMKCERKRHLFSPQGYTPVAWGSGSSYRDLHKQDLCF